MSQTPKNVTDPNRQHAIETSPCLALCSVDGLTGHCIGCQRKMKEIAGWWSMTIEEREAILADLPHRAERNKKIREEKLAAIKARQAAKQVQ